MKKFLSLILAGMLLLSFACAEGILDADPEEVLTLMRNERTDELTVNWTGKTEADVLALYAGTSHVSNWVGQWELVAAYISEEFADDNDVEVNGFLPVPQGAIVMNVEAILDGSNTGSPDGIMIDQGSYWHGHAYDLLATLTFAEDLDIDGATVKSAWDQWPTTKATGEQTGFFNFGPTKVSVKCEDDTMGWEAVTGVEIEDMEKMKYMGLTNAGYLVLCYSDTNVANKDGDMGVCYIFARVAE